MTAIEAQLIIGPQATPARRDEVAGIARALAEAGLRVRAVGPGDAADVVHLVWADELDDVLAHVDGDRERWLECTVIVNEARDRVLELLGARDLLGAVEYEDVADWSAAPGRLFVRKDVVQKRGERIDGPGRDSFAYTLWSDPDAASMAACLARYLEYWRQTDSELVVDAEEARRGGLPPVEVRLKVGGTGLSRVPREQAPAAYVAMAGAPGGGAGFSIGPLPDGSSLEQAARQRLEKPNGQELHTVETCTLQLAGGEREAICLFSEYLLFRTARCVVRIDHAGGALMAIFTARIGGGAPSCATVLANPSLKRIARSLRVVDAGPKP